MGRNLFKLGIIFGGTGPEHEASLSNARSILDHYHNENVAFKLFGIDKAGNWFVGDEAWNLLYSKANPDLLPSVIRGRNAVSTGQCEMYRNFPPSNAFFDVDCVFPLVDGVGGEDGTLTGFLTFVGKPVVGCSLLGAALSYNKWSAKQIAKAAGIGTAFAMKFDHKHSVEAVASTVETHFEDWNLIVKPNACGSGFGVTHIQSKGELAEAIAHANSYGSCYLVERYVEGLELFIGVVGEGIEVKTGFPSLDLPTNERRISYHDNYISSKFYTTCRNDLSDDVNKRLQHVAAHVYDALGCEQFARVDLFYAPQTNEITFNEVNTIPTISPSDAFSLGMKEIGFEYSELIDMLIFGSGATLPTKREVDLKRKIGFDRSHVLG